MSESTQDINDQLTTFATQMFKKYSNIQNLLSHLKIHIKLNISRMQDGVSIKQNLS